MKPQLPWYREFWPWFIVALIGSVLMASIATIGLALKYNDAPAEGHYQKQGLGIVATELTSYPDVKTGSQHKQTEAEARKR
ncbi:MAG: hypothetical protein AB8B48_14115 [Pseudomonadales bacterium]